MGITKRFATKNYIEETVATLNTSIVTKVDVEVLQDYIPISSKGDAYGVASLNANGKIPSEQLIVKAMNT